MNIQPNPDFLKKLAAMFVVEAREHVQTLGVDLIGLEKAAGPDAQQPLFETLVREVHCLKGAARGVNAGEIERLCQTLEGALSDLKAGRRELAATALDGLHRAVAVLGRLVDAFEAGTPATMAEVAAVLQQLRAVPVTETAAIVGEIAPNGSRSRETSGVPAETRIPASSATGDVETVPAETRILANSATGNSETADRAADTNPSTAPHAAGSAADTVRVAAGKLDAIFVQAEELLGVKLAQAERGSEVRALAAVVAEQDRFWAETTPLVRSVRQQLEATADAPRQANAGTRTPELTARLLALFDQQREQAEAVSSHVADLARREARDRRRFETLVDRLLEDVKKALMLPFETILANFPKMARDLARDAGKDVDCELRGADIEIDKRILEKIKAPLLHLLRNGVDHGLEPPAERTRRGKPPRGSLTLAVSQAGGKVEIQFADDGAGLDVAAVKAAAVQAGIITADDAAALRDQDAWQLVFESGVTTNREVTTISGRGLGMAIVRESVTKLGGTVRIESTPGAGTTTRILLPLTLATLRGTLVRVANREFVIPTANVARALRVTRASVNPVEGRDSIRLDGTTLALVTLAEVLGLPPAQTTADSTAPLTVLVLDHGWACMAFAVDQVLGEQEVLAKPLGRLLPRVRNLAGATVLGTGRVVPILSVPDLLQAAAGCTGATGLETATPQTVRAKRVLVADDSITARTVLQSILESAGYEVQTAADGAAAYATLRSETFDLLVSDVEMPRMDGFELTKRVRAEPRLTGLPIVLVTAREAKDDRERGVDAGANGYIVKSSFEESNLLEVIARIV